MKKNFILAIILSLLTVTSTGCGLVAELIEGFDSVMADTSEKAEGSSRSNNSTKDKNSDSENLLSDVLKLDKNTGEEATEATEATTEAITESVTEPVTEQNTVEGEESTEPVTNSEGSENVQTSEPATEAGTSAPADSNVLYDEAGLKITFIDCVEKYGTLKANMSFENSSDVAFEVQVRDVYVNGQPVSAIMSVSTEIGNTIEDSMKMNVEKLEKAGIKTSDIQTIELSFHIFNWSDKSVSIDTPRIKINI
ncbi:MAG: hypothetical protein UD936_09770 [Acutalibacteraceae bacterium]|nr:hypothetical protein [Acutalibacteraceae bacterium]